MQDKIGGIRSSNLGLDAGNLTERPPSGQLYRSACLRVFSGVLVIGFTVLTLGAWLERPDRVLSLLPICFLVALALACGATIIVHWTLNQHAMELQREPSRGEEASHPTNASRPHATVPPQGIEQVTVTSPQPAGDTPSKPPTPKDLTAVQQFLKRDMANRAEPSANGAPPSSQATTIALSTETFEILEATEKASPILATLKVGPGQPLPPDWDELVRAVAQGHLPGDLELACGEDTYDIQFSLEPATQRLTLIGRNITEHRAAEERIRQLANIDTLTGLPNRALFRDRLEQVLRQAKRSGAAAAVHMIDVDHFKDVNDTLGHSKGDRLLRMIGERLAVCVRDSDTVARLGGDEFAIIQVGGTDASGASVLAQKVLDIFQKPFDVDGEEIHSDASIGVTLFPEEAVSTEQILRNADMALYRAKGEGRGRYRFFISDMNEEVQKLKAIEADMRKALEEEGQFQLYYQPKLDLRSGRINGMEALIRWIHPEKGFLSPAEFIPVAEKTKLIIPVGAWSLRTACQQTKAWADAGIDDLKVAVNLSAIQFRERGLIDLVASVLEETGLKPEYLELEITEGVAMEDAEVAIKLFNQFQEMGVTLSIDDFGTGYSSLSYLKNFPVKRVKIDKAFVDDISAGGGNEGAIAKAVTTLGHSFSMAVTAEGVETEEQLKFLTNLGVDEIQGYYFSRPLPVDEFTSFVGSFNKQVKPGQGNGSQGLWGQSKQDTPQTITVGQAGRAVS